MAMNMLAANTGITITFLDWTIICAPLAIIVLIVAWAWLMLVSKPERLTDEAQAAIQERGKNVGKFDALDWKTIGIMLLLVVLWVASNWTGWDATSIAVLGLVLFFIPGIDVLTWKEFVKSIAWSIVILIGGVQSLAGGIQEQGAASWLLQGTVAAFTAAGGLAVTAAASFFIPIIRCFLPIGPAIIRYMLDSDGSDSRHRRRQSGSVRNYCWRQCVYGISYGHRQ